MRQLDIPKGGAFFLHFITKAALWFDYVVYRRKKAERIRYIGMHTESVPPVYQENDKHKVF
jgi:hypothetical protein